MYRFWVTYAREIFYEGYTVETKTLGSFFSPVPHASAATAVSPNVIHGKSTKVQYRIIIQN